MAVTESNASLRSNAASAADEEIKGPTYHLTPSTVKALRAMGGEGRANLGAKMRRDHRRWMGEALQAQHPEWDEPRLQAELAKIYLRASTQQH